MKNVKRLTIAFLTGLGLLSSSFIATAQDAEVADEATYSFDAGVDFYSSYVFRGVKFGTGPALQPWLSFTAGGLEVGAWGSTNVTQADAIEMDLYASYSFDFGLSLGLTDYYYPGSDYFDVSDTAGSHGIEINAGYEIKGLSVAANYIVNEAPSAGTVGGDMYFELGYGFDKFSLFVGAGDGWHTSDSEFNLCNVGISTEKEIEITDKFSLPLSGSVILNPDSKQFFIVVGISL